MPSATVSVRILAPLMNVVAVLVPPVPMPLLATVDFMVTSANAGAAGATSATSAASAASVKRFIGFFTGKPILLLLRRGDPRLGVLGPFVRPVQHFGDSMQHRFAGGVAMRFIGQRHVADRGAVALE